MNRLTLAKTLHQHSFWDDTCPWDELAEKTRQDWLEMADRFQLIYNNGGRKL